MELKDRLKLFYDEMRERYQLESDEVKKILTDKEIVRFNSEEVPLYRRVIAEYVFKHGKVKNSLMNTPPPEPCPIPECGGEKRRGKYWPWYCTNGGLRHFLAYRGAEIMIRQLKLDATPEDKALWMLERMSDAKQVQ